MDAKKVFNRRTAIASGVVATMGTAAFRSRLLAQEPETPDADQDAESGDDDRFSQLEDRLAEALATVQADIDALVAQIDPAVIDEIVTRAGGFLAAAGTGDDSGAGQRLAAVIPMLAAAELLIGAQLVVASPPSREAPANRILERTNAAIEAAGSELVASEDADVPALLATARDLSASASDQFGSGAYVPAMRTGRASALLVRAARIAAGERPGRGRRGRRRNRRGEGTWDMADDLELAGFEDDLLMSGLLEPVGVPVS